MKAPERKFLLFSLQEDLFALDLAQVAEVADPPDLSPIPLAPPCCSGAFNFHGDVVAVLSLARLLDREEQGCRGKLLVLKQEGVSLAFLVDDIVRIVPEGEVSFGAAPENKFAAVSVKVSDGEAPLLDLETLVSMAELLMEGLP